MFDICPFMFKRMRWWEAQANFDFAHLYCFGVSSLYLQLSLSALDINQSAFALERVAGVRDTRACFVAHGERTVGTRTTASCRHADTCRSVRLQLNIDHQQQHYVVLTCVLKSVRSSSRARLAGGGGMRTGVTGVGGGTHASPFDFFS
jgi:hypothetical protein